MFNEIIGIVWVLLIFSAPAGMIVLWKSDRYTETARIAVSLASTLWFVFAAIAGAAL